jgi:hypothetical protein
LRQATSDHHNFGWLSGTLSSNGLVSPRPLSEPLPKGAV